MGRVRVGISGWTFPPWRGPFYPKDVTQKRELEWASQQLETIEINGTFYSLQRPTTFQKWRDSTPDDFVFAVKAPQYITHIRRAVNIDEPLANFMASGLLCLGEKLGPILWQFPPSLALKDDRFEEFFKKLPRDTKAAAKLAKKHSAFIEGRAFTKCLAEAPLRHAFEFRNESFATPKFLDLMRKHNVAFVYAHTGTPEVREPTTDFVYMRMHGQGQAYAKGYGPAALKDVAQQAKSFKRKRDVFVYFDEEHKVRSPKDALSLVKLL
jgi:uncharacterized protein YecE (DUF72 family)